MSDQIVKFELPDASGVPHKYIVALTPAEKGMGVSMQLMGMVSASAFRSLGGILLPALYRSMQGSSLTDLLDSKEALSDMLGAAQTADWGASGEAVGALLQSPRTVQFCRQTLLATVIRDGKSLATEPGAFDQAFTANYGELWSLLIKVIDINGFFALPSTWADAMRQAKLKAEAEAAAAAAKESTPAS